MPAGCLASLEAVPTAGWLQIMVLICMQEAGTGFASKPQTDDAEAGDIALDEEETPVDIATLSARELKALVASAGLGYADCIEKSELRARRRGAAAALSSPAAPLA